jgi:hypothetical protein
MVAVRELSPGLATLSARRRGVDVRPWLLALSLIDGGEAPVVLAAVRRGEVATANGLAFAAADARSAAAGLGVMAQIRRRHVRVA